MSVNPRQEVPGRWPPFNAAIIVTIVWIDNHAHYSEMRGEEEGSCKLLGLLVVRPRRSDGQRLKGREHAAPEGTTLPLGFMGKPDCSEGFHLMWVSQTHYLSWRFHGEQRLMQSWRSGQESWSR